MGKKKSPEGSPSAAADAKPEKKENKQPKMEFPEEPAKPDIEANNAAKQILQDEIDKLIKELEGYTAKINEKQEGKEEYEAQKGVLQQDFLQAKEYFDTLRTQHQDCVGKLKSQHELKKRNAGELRDLKKVVEEDGEEGIDRKIKELEFKMHTSTLKLSEEKYMMKQIQDLKRKRPEMQKMAQKLEQLEQNKEMSEMSKAPLEVQLKEVKEKIDIARKEKDEKHTLLNDLRDSRQGQRSAIQDLIKSKEGIKGQINDKRDKIRALRDAQKDEERAHRNWQWECTQIRRKHKEAQMQKEWEAWEAEKKKQELEQQNEKPYFEEMALLEQTILYCKGLIGDTAEKKVEEEKQVTHDAPEGCKVMLSKKDRDAEMFCPATKRKNKKQKEKKENKNVKHTAGTMLLFTQLKLKAPMTTEDIPQTLAELDTKMEVYNEKIRDWQEKRDNLQKEVDELAKAKADEEAAAEE